MKSELRSKIANYEKELEKAQKAIHARVYTIGYNRPQNVCERLYNSLQCQNIKSVFPKESR